MDRNDDAGQLEALIARFFGAFDNRNGRMGSVQEITDLFLEDAVIAKAAGSSFETWRPRQFAEPRIALLQSGELQDFHEWETSATTEIHGRMAARHSRYAKEGIWSGKPYSGSGTKCFLFAKTGDAWHILSIAWEDDVA
ncbi:MAG TPA: hypothetical protein VN436_14360 [Holophaga sp.]|nr:hypothetical protein [Holophaga sp.]